MTDVSSPIRLLARIAYNTQDWQRPTGEAAELESGESYNAMNRFGHEEWLFRSEWLIDGWRYAFIQGFNKNGQAYRGRPLEVTLFTRLPDKRHRLVATINELECLADDQAQAALAVFRSRGWLSLMEDEIRAIDGNVGAFGDPAWAQNVLNVRYRLENLDRHPSDNFLPDSAWFSDRHRYLLYKFDGVQREQLEQSIRGHRGTAEPPSVRHLFRRGTKPTEYSPEHDKMQARLMAELRNEYGPEHVSREQDFVDLRVDTEKELIFFEIKSDLCPRAVIRQALGQLLEYAYHPLRPGRRPARLVIVGRTPLNAQDQSYLDTLTGMFGLPLAYRVIQV